MIMYVCHSDPGMERFKFIFTLRDSPSDYVNVTCWGSEEYIKGLHSSFKISDVGELELLTLMCGCDHFDVPISIRRKRELSKTSVQWIYFSAPQPAYTI